MQVKTHIILKDGTAVIEGKEHLKAEMVARMVVDGGYSIAETMAHYSLSAAEVHASLAYYYDHQADLDARRAQILEEIHQNSMTLEKFTARLAHTPPPSES